MTEPATGQALLIDAPDGVWAEVEPILAREKCQLTDLWITHGHWDDTQGTAQVVRAAGKGLRAQGRREAHRDAGSAGPPAPTWRREPGSEPVKVDVWLDAPGRMAALGTEAEVRHVPGHCPGNVLFYFAGSRAAFVGDALFRGSIGRTDLPGGGFPILENSIRTQIYTLPDDTIVHPGHGPETTVGEEKEGNPYVRSVA